MDQVENYELATVGGGCYWCIEACFQATPGVIEVASGYAGGDESTNPTHDDVKGGKLGHAEVVHLKFDPSKVQFLKIS